jgi:hypothetical protein
MSGTSKSEQPGLLEPQPGEGSLVRHLTTRELALRWSMSPRTLERWRHRGWEPLHISLPGRVVYRLADVESYEAERRCKSAEMSVRLSARGSGTQRTSDADPFSVKSPHGAEP